MRLVKKTRTGPINQSDAKFKKQSRLEQSHFPAFEAACFHLEFLLVNENAKLCSDWSICILWFYDTQLKNRSNEAKPSAIQNYFRHLIKRYYNTFAREVVFSTWGVLAGPRPLFENASLSLAQRSFVILLITLHTELN